MKAFDFFCGAGGLSRGLINAGIDVVAGFDSDDNCRQSYENNNPDAKFIHSDIRTLNVNDLSKLENSRNFDDYLFAGCAPCQTFSQQRKRKNKDLYSTLLSEFGRIVNSALPGQILIENVPGIAKVKGFSTYRRFLKILDNNNYQYVVEVLNAKHFGVPQNRRRLVLIAMRNCRPSFPSKSHGNKQQPFITVKDTIAMYPPIKAGKSNPNVPNHVAASITPTNLNRLRHTPHDGGGRNSWPESLKLECHKGNYKGHTDVYGRMHWDRPAPTLTGRCYSISNGRYGHPVQNRAISLREAAALQTFPDNYVFYGSNTHIALQVGNAVPVRLAERLGRHILELRNQA